MNTLRQLAARIARQCAVAVACAFNALCGMQRCYSPPPPPPRKFEIKFALRRIGILAGFAVCILTLAAPDAQAQTSCEAGETAIGGVCVPNAITVGAQNCVDANRDLSAANGGSCGINVTLFGGDLYDKCYFSGNSQPQCVDVFGAGLAFPEKSDPTRFTDPPFVYNCDPNGMTGLIPATINTIHTVSCRCPLGQETNSNGVCAAIECPDEERVVKNSTEAGCFANEVADIADACTANGWSIGGFIFLDELVCSPLSILYDDDSSRAGGTGCAITGADDSFPPCKTMFGDPPQFPTATGDDDKRNFVANCSRGGNIPGAIPATINTISATECTCDRDSGYAGDWPNCVKCDNGEGVLADGTCGVCPALIENGICIACPLAGQDVNNSGVCVCPDNHTPFGGVCIPDSPRNFGELSDAVLCEAFGGEVLQQSFLNEADLIKRLHDAAVDNPATAPIYNAMTVAMQAKIDGDIETVNTFLSNYDTGGALYNAPAYNGIVLAADNAYGFGTFNAARDNELARILARVPVDFSGKICSGMDANDTFCIMDSAVGFPCRGLFKHLRSCNVQFNRKALNPFFCGEKCGVQKAVGSECR